MGIEISRSGGSAAALKMVATLLREIADVADRAARGESGAREQLARALVSLKPNPKPNPRPASRCFPEIVTAKAPASAEELEEPFKRYGMDPYKEKESDGS